MDRERHTHTVADRLLYTGGTPFHPLCVCLCVLGLFFIRLLHAVKKSRRKKGKAKGLRPSPLVLWCGGGGGGGGGQLNQYYRYFYYYV